MSKQERRNTITIGMNNLKSSKLKNQKMKKTFKKEKKNANIQNSTNDTSLNEINDIINSKNLSKRIYSKSFAEPYRPLSQLEKVKEINNMNENSFKRFKTYSTLFEQIKKEIYDINTNLNNSLHLKKQSNDIFLKNYNLNIDIPIIEQDDENCSPIQMKTINKIKIPLTDRGKNEKTQSTIVLNNSNSNENSELIDDNINQSSLNENVQNIILSPTEESESMQSMRLKNKMMTNQFLYKINSFRNYQLRDKKYNLGNKVIKEENTYNKSSIYDKDFYNHTNDKNVSCNCSLQ
jgi:hypothetical protein